MGLTEEKSPYLPRRLNSFDGSCAVPILQNLLSLGDSEWSITKKMQTFTVA